MSDRELHRKKKKLKNLFSTYTCMLSKLGTNKTQNTSSMFHEMERHADTKEHIFWGGSTRIQVVKRRPELAAAWLGGGVEPERDELAANVGELQVTKGHNVRLPGSMEGKDMWIQASVSTSLQKQ